VQAAGSSEMWVTYLYTKLYSYHPRGAVILKV